MQQNGLSISLDGSTRGAKNTSVKSDKCAYKYKNPKRRFLEIL